MALPCLFRVLSVFVCVCVCVFVCVLYVPVGRACLGRLSVSLSACLCVLCVLCVCVSETCGASMQCVRKGLYPRCTCECSLGVEVQ